MASSSDDEAPVFSRKSLCKRLLDSDDDDDGTQMRDGTEDFVLRMSDEGIDSDSDMVSSQNCVNDTKKTRDSADNEERLTSHVSADDSGEIGISRNTQKRISCIKPVSDSEEESVDQSVPKGKQVLPRQTHRNNTLSDDRIPSKFDILKKKGNDVPVDNKQDFNSADLMKKLAALADSDSSIDGDLEPLSDNSPVKKNRKHKKGVKKSVHKSKHSDDEPGSGVVPSLTGDLYDAEVSSDDDHQIVQKNDRAAAKSKPRRERKSKTAAKDAMLEIKAESQRQLRHSSVGLPYHLPKQRSLSEFLNRRKSSPMPIKGSTEQLVEVWKQIEERTKDAEDFYKSESENEEEGDKEKEELDKMETVSDEIAKVTENRTDECSGIEASSHEALITELAEKPSSDMGTDEFMVTDLPNGNHNSKALNSDSDVSTVLQESSGKRDDSPQLSVPFEDKSQDITLRLSETQPCSSDSVDIGSEKCKDLIFSKHDQNSCVSVESKNSSGDLVCKKNQENYEESSDFVLKFSESEKEDCHSVVEVANKQVEQASAETSKEVENSKDVDKEKQTVFTWEQALQMSDSDNDNDDGDEDEKVKKSDENLSAPYPARLSLRGNPDEVIDLDDVTPRQPRTPGVESLIQRFMKHSAGKKKQTAPQTVEISLVSSERDTCGGVVDIKHESLSVVLTGDDEGCPEFQRPGARLKMLKDELHKQMKKQKQEEWQRKQEAMKEDEVFEGEKDDCGMLDDNTDDDEDEEEDLTESEPELDDVRQPKKKEKRVKSAFVDEEAEDEDEDADRDTADSENEEQKELNDDDHISSHSDTDDGNDGDDDDDEEDNDDRDNDVENNDEEHYAHKRDGVSPSSQPLGILKRSMTSADLFASQESESLSHLDTWQDDDDDFIPAAQPNGGKRSDGICKMSDETTETFKYSPLTMTMPKKAQNSMDYTDSEPTPMKRGSFTSILGENSRGVAKLFSDLEPSTQDNIDELIGLCSGKFTDDTMDGIRKLTETPSTQSEDDLMALCSGKFLSQPVHPDELENSENAVMPDLQLSQTQAPSFISLESQATTVAVEDSQDFSLKWNDDSNRPKNKTAQWDTEFTTVKRVELEIVSSDDEAVNITKEKPRKKNKKLDFSDDEDDDEPDEAVITDDEDEERRFKPISAELDKEETGKDRREIMYDSDENEIEPTTFFENEAELSEEEWDGSEDEDEKGLDQLEMNEADKEDIDQDEVREDLIKNHMKKMLDEDRRDVRILQEMLLEDGELHSEGGGRERQFRWRNVDSTGMVNDLHNSDEENGDVEDDYEDDAEWRRQRYEREMFLKEQREKQSKNSGEKEEENDDILENSELLQLGKAALHKSRCNSSEVTGANEPLVSKPSLPNTLASPDGRKHQVLAKRGSFLTRSEGVLAKLAQLTGSKKENVAGGAKNSRKFVFTAVSPTKEEAVKEEPEPMVAKRKAPSGLSNPKSKKPCVAGPVRRGSGLFDHL